MKHLLLFSLIILTGFSAMAQPAKGKLFAGGEISLMTGSDKSKYGGTTLVNGKQTEFNLLPMMGVFVSDKVSIGAMLGINTKTIKYPNDLVDNVSYSGMVFNPFVRYYLISGNAGLFAEATMSVEKGKYKGYYNTGIDEARSVLLGFGVTPGAYYCISPALTLECKLGWFGYQSQTITYNDDSKEVINEFGLGVHPSSLSFGITFMF